MSYAQSMTRFDAADEDQNREVSPPKSNEIFMIIDQAPVLDVIRVITDIGSES